MPDDYHDDPGEPCPACGWALAVTEVVTVVVESRENVARLARRTGRDSLEEQPAAHATLLSAGLTTKRAASFASEAITFPSGCNS
jgi:hypothetical protein